MPNFPRLICPTDIFHGTLAAISFDSNDPSVDLMAVRGNRFATEIMRLGRSGNSDLEDNESGPASATTIAEALWIAGKIRDFPKPSIQLLDEGEIAFSWVTDGILADFQFDGSGDFCVYIGHRPNRPIMHQKIRVTSGELENSILPKLRSLLNAIG